MEKKPVHLTINGKAIEADSQMTVIQAASQAGIFIPHYCYHPDLPIAGVCRMCMVEVEKQPKLQISCNTQVAEGMVVQTNTPKVKETVKGVLELHLINHPLDCPICDKAGECKLQDFYSDYGLYQSRMELDRKVHKPKVVDIGTIVLDSERCILCTRCVRFTSDVTKTHEFGIFNRGDRSELKTYDDGPLRNDYTGNLADICPVGALTAKDFRFQCRVWFLEKTQSVCAQCAQGCNTTVSVNPQTHKLYRVEPRRNPEVNKSWICDLGRWDYHYVYNENRVKVPRKQLDGSLTEFTWDHAFKEIRQAVESDPNQVLVALSTQSTNEEIADVVESFKVLGVDHFTWLVDEDVVDEKEPWDGLLKHHDLTSNAQGFQKMMTVLKVPWLRYTEAKNYLDSGRFQWVFLLGMEGDTRPGVKSLVSSIPSQVRIIAHATNEPEFSSKCAMVLPAATSFEKSGTVINAQGRIQKLNAAIAWQETARDLHALVFGISNGHDRAIFPENRAQVIFETIVVERMLGPQAKWRSFDPMGKLLTESA